MVFLFFPSPGNNLNCNTFSEPLLGKFHNKKSLIAEKEILQSTANDTVRIRTQRRIGQQNGYVLRQHCPFQNNKIISGWNGLQSRANP